MVLIIRNDKVMLRKGWLFQVYSSGVAKSLVFWGLGVFKMSMKPLSQREFEKWSFSVQKVDISHRAKIALFQSPKRIFPRSLEERGFLDHLRTQECPKTHDLAREKRVNLSQSMLKILSGSIENKLKPSWWLQRDDYCANCHFVSGTKITAPRKIVVRRTRERTNYRN